MNESPTRPTQDQIEEAVTTTLVGWGRELDRVRRSAELVKLGAGV